jgi:hypothetical protein
MPQAELFRRGPSHERSHPHWYRPWQAQRGSHRGAGNYLPIMTPDRFALASLVSTPDYLAKTGLTMESVTGSRTARTRRNLASALALAMRRHSRTFGSAVG